MKKKINPFILNPIAFSVIAVIAISSVLIYNYSLGYKVKEHTKSGEIFATMSSGELKKVANIKEFIFVATILIIFQPDSYCLTCTIREYEL